MTRELDTVTLDQAGQDFARNFLDPTVWSPYNPEIARRGRDWTMQSLKNAHFKDEFDYLLPRVRGNLGSIALKEFDDLASKTFKTRSDDELKQALKERLAQDVNGKQIPGAIGKVIKGSHKFGYRPHIYRNLKNGTEEILAAPVFVDVHVGEDVDEAVARALKAHQSAGLAIATMAVNTNVSAAVAKAMCDAAVDSLDGGTGAGLLRGYSGTQPVDPDASITGTLLFTCVLTDPAFGNAADITPSARATASSITNDSSADATNTLTHCRGWSTNDGATPLLAIIDGNANTSSADFVFNTVAIVSGSTISITSWTVTVPQGPTAT